VKFTINVKQVLTWLAIGFFAYLVWQSTATTSVQLNTYLGAVFGFLGELIEKTMQFLSGAVGGNDGSTA
jgi:hypothetical protein